MVKMLLVKADVVAQWVKLPHTMLASRMVAGLHLGCFFLMQLPANVEIWPKHLHGRPGWNPSPGHCGHLESEAADGRAHLLPLHVIVKTLKNDLKSYLEILHLGSECLDSSLGSA